MDTKKTTSIRLSEDGKQLRKKLAKKLGLSESAVIELAIRRLAGMEDVKTEEEKSPAKELSPVE
jgi:predicted DNA-binding protein